MTLKLSRRDADDQPAAVIDELINMLDEQLARRPELAAERERRRAAAGDLGSGPYEGIGGHLTDPALDARTANEIRIAEATGLDEDKGDYTVRIHVGEG